MTHRASLEAELAALDREVVRYDHASRSNTGRTQPYSRRGFAIVRRGPAWFAFFAALFGQPMTDEQSRIYKIVHWS